MTALSYKLQSQNLPIKFMLTQKEIVNQIEAIRLRADSYMDAIITVAENNNMDVVDIAEMIGPIIKNKLEVECIRKRIIDGDAPVELDA